MHAFAQNLAQRSVKQVRSCVIPLGVEPAIAGNASRCAPERKATCELADRGWPTVDLLDVIDVDTPAVADNLAAVGDLPARLGVERRLAQHHSEATVG